MGEAAQALGKPTTVSFQGRSFSLAPFDIDMIAMFETWLENRAWDAVERVRHRITPAEYERRLGLVTEQVAAGKYSYGSVASAEAAQSRAGRKFIAFLQLMRNPGMTEELASEIWEAEFAQLQAKMRAMEAEKEEPDPLAEPSPSLEAGTT